MNGIWNSSIPGDHNALLSVVILHPIYSVLLNMRLTDVFRIVHPLHYSFTPIALYEAFRKQTSEKIAFLSVFFYMFMHTFYVQLSWNTRAGIAEFFLALFVLLITDKTIAGVKKAMLSIIFMFSIVVSHYGTSYTLIFLLIASTLVLFLINWSHVTAEDIKRTLRPTLSVLYTVFALAWYIYNSNTTGFKTLVGFLDHMVTQISYFFSPETSYTVYALSRKWPFSIEVSKVLLIIANFFIAIGITSLIWSIVKREKTGFQEEFAILSILSFGAILATFFPTRGFNTGRIFHLLSCFLAPFVVVGFIQLCDGFKKMFKKFKDDECVEHYLKIFSIFLMMTLLFNSGFVSEVITRGSDYPPNILITKPRALSIKNDAQYISSFQVLVDQEVFSAKWLSQKKNETIKTYLDRYYDLLLLPIAPSLSKSSIYVGNKTKIKNGYMFLNIYNVVRGVSVIQDFPPKIKNVSEVYPIDNSNKIYTNGKIEIYYR